MLHCAQRIFTERLPQVVAPYGRSTTRLVEVLRLLAFVLGGEAGARVIHWFCVVVPLVLVV